MDSLLVMLTIVSDGLVTLLMAMSTVGVYLMKELFVVLLLLAVVEALRSFLHLILQLIVFAISLLLAAVVYTSSFLISAGGVLFAEPLQHAVACQHKSMAWMNSYLPANE